MKSPAVKALETEIQELSDKMGTLAKALSILMCLKEKKERKKRTPKVRKDEDMIEEDKKNEWPPEPKKKKSKAVLNPPVDPAT